MRHLLLCSVHASEMQVSMGSGPGGALSTAVYQRFRSKVGSTVVRWSEITSPEWNWNQAPKNPGLLPWHQPVVHCTARHHLLGCFVLQVASNGGLRGSHMARRAEARTQGWSRDGIWRTTMGILHCRYMIYIELVAYLSFFATIDIEKPCWKGGVLKTPRFFWRCQEIWGKKWKETNKNGETGGIKSLWCSGWNGMIWVFFFLGGTPFQSTIRWENLQETLEHLGIIWL